MDRSTIETVDMEINAIRNAARLSVGMGVMTECPTCGKSTPYRRVDADGHIFEGCIDAFHGPALQNSTGADVAWHMRETAVSLRTKTLQNLAR